MIWFKKRLFALIASSILTLSFLAGCGEATQPQPTASEEYPTMPTIDPLPPEGTETAVAPEATEVATDGIHWNFSPVLCLARDPRWGRTDETLLTGKSRQNIIVDFAGPDGLMGHFTDVKITKALPWALVGETV